MKKVVKPITPKLPKNLRPYAEIINQIKTPPLQK